MQIPYGLVRPVLFKLDAERAHRLTLRLLTAMPPSRIADDPPSLRTTVAGLRFSNPVGIAAGFDKNAEVLNPLLRLGFGFVEAGTVTPLPQPGNPKPRMFRLTEDQAVINRLGFNNNGLEQALDKFKERAWHRGPRGVTGLNVGANKDSRDRIADYALSVEHAAPFVDYITVNISSPNTPGLRTLQSKDELAELLGRVMDARGHRKTPIFLKVAPDVTDADIGDIAVSVVAAGVDGLVVSNTTTERPDTLKSAHASEPAADGTIDRGAARVPAGDRRRGAADRCRRHRERRRRLCKDSCGREPRAALHRARLSGAKPRWGNQDGARRSPPGGRLRTGLAGRGRRRLGCVEVQTATFSTRLGSRT